MPKINGVKLFGNMEVNSSTDVSPSTTAYADGDLIGGVLTFSNVLSADRGGGVVLDAALIDTSTVAASIDLYLFDSEPSSVVADNASFDPTNAHLDTLVGKFSFSSGDVKQFANNQIVTSGDVEQGFEIEGKHLYGVLVSRGTPTYPTANTLSVRLKIQRETN